MIFAPAGPLVPAALRHVDKGGCVVCAGVHMDDIASLPCAWLWSERSVRSVASLTRQDGVLFIASLRKSPLRSEVRVFALEQANEALEQLRHSAFQDAAVLGMALPA